MLSVKVHARTGREEAKLEYIPTRLAAAVHARSDCERERLAQLQRRNWDGGKRSKRHISDDSTATVYFYPQAETKWKPFSLESSA